jgi:hypothetical protein
MVLNLLLCLHHARAPPSPFIAFDPGRRAAGGPASNERQDFGLSEAVAGHL